LRAAPETEEEKGPGTVGVLRYPGAWVGHLSGFRRV
jgi:hypothetical protein